MAEFFADYGLFLLKTLTIVIAIVAVMAAAVGDFRPAGPFARKIKKEDLVPGAGIQIDLVANPDILAERQAAIANNIANVNTVGYKASRVTFEEAFAQLVQGASRPPGSSSKEAAARWLRSSPLTNGQSR